MRNNKCWAVRTYTRKIYNTSTTGLPSATLYVVTAKRPLSQPMPPTHLATNHDRPPRTRESQTLQERIQAGTSRTIAPYRVVC